MQARLLMDPQRTVTLPMAHRWSAQARLNLIVDIDEAVETLGAAGDTTTLLEADDEERSSRPDVGTDSYTVNAVVTDASGTQLHGGRRYRYEHRF